MLLQTYSTLIRNMPVGQQAFMVKRTNWDSLENNNIWYRDCNNVIFENQDKIFISRNDLFNLGNRIGNEFNPTIFILKTIYWGYPKGMRGRNFQNIIYNFETLKNIIQNLHENRNIGNFIELHNHFNVVHGVGMSTLTKFLYFLKANINGNAALILDKRLQDVFNQFTFEELDIEIGNTPACYINYLNKMYSISNNLNCLPEQLEMFLFTFGKNLKE